MRTPIYIEHPTRRTGESYREPGSAALLLPQKLVLTKERPQAKRQRLSGGYGADSGDPMRQRAGKRERHARMMIFLVFIVVLNCSVNYVLIRTLQESFSFSWDCH